MGEGFLTVGHGSRQRAAGGLLLIGRYKPGGQGLQAGGVGVILRVSGLEVVLPVGSGKVRGFPEDAVAGVVLDFPGFIVFVESEHLRGALVMVKVVLAHEGRGVSIRPEDHDREAVNALAHSFVLQLGWRLVGAGVVVQPGQFHVVRAFTGGHVSLEGEGVGRDRTGAQREGFQRAAAAVLESALELDLVVLAGVGRGGCTLHVGLGLLEGEAPGGVNRVGEAAADRLLVTLGLWQLRSLQHQVRQILRQVLDHDLAVGVEHVVAQVALQHIAAVLGVRDPVVQHLEAGQVVVIDANTVQVDRAVVGADGNAHGRSLGEVVVGRVLHDAAHDAVDVAIDQPVLHALLDHKGQTHVFVFLVLGENGGLLRRHGRQLGRQYNATPAGQAGQDHSVVVHDVTGRELDLDSFASAAEVSAEDVQRDFHAGVARHA